MRTSDTPLRTSYRFILLAALVTTLAVGIAGCGRTKAPELRSYGEPSGVFHIKVPETWPTVITPTGMTIRAAEDLPTEETFDALSFIVSVNPLDDEGDIADRLAEIVEARAEQRGWQTYDIGEVEDAALGNRIAAKRHVRGVEANGIEFRADFTVARTNKREVLVVALAPAESWDEDTAEIEELLLRQWFWHIPDPAAMVDLQSEVATDTVSDVERDDTEE